ncbi:MULTISPECIES: type I DNA topoisomerase [unclassified Anaerobiospirillum]|uniref:type I DNA topoisomerase n=1 Tax=unclassified Anaerobiospirillum TaxID=2647410 RepID=UPI001FF2D0F0|nr:MULTISPECIES: type I DNA topoisomerase [unclassified Anaerobiospirillum]MCK0525595.1 type I DNA topoisomerase [Anaerobiospirillum sp. NML120449]MCK0533679.1 type I DNA topoisomerase [Anaerobiospirillum sp. NML120511]MCK0539642.1 type I DNA topoisomerase [Anaerobiospirillum sp. NML02-A-032]
MGKALVIVESPSKAKIINNYLGEDYIVKASVGHIRDLPTGATKSRSAKGEDGEPVKRTRKTAEEKRSALFDRMGIDPLNGWKAHYEIMPEKTAVVAELKRLAKSADVVYLATDLDREGEAIAWHLREILSSKKEDKPFWRVKYPEITRSAIQKAFANPEQVNMDMVNAQQTRRFLDRVVGFMVSPLLWEKVGRGLSAGRVQSVAVELIVDREREIKAFIPEEYWTISANTLTPGQEQLQLMLATEGKSKVNITNAAQAQEVVNQLLSQTFQVVKIESKKGSAHAPAPFTTSTLQQSANTRLGFSVKKTMTVAQRLYESGLITYMRTDSVNLSQEAIDAARDIIAENYGKQYLPEKPNIYQSKESAQEAHEAIRPSHPELKQLPGNIDRDGQRLYQLIFERYLACQMSNNIYETRSITVQAGNYFLRATGRTDIFDGFRILLGGRSDDKVLPDVSEGDTLKLEELIPAQHFTQPPARFSEATLVKELEKDGIGRPSTYASIINTIQERGYVKVERNRFFATKMGEIVTDRLRYSFANLMDYHFTASMEESLDEIAAGRRNWISSLDEFYKDFSDHLEKAMLPADQGGMPENRAIETDIMCPSCHKYHMAIHMGRTGTFLSCMGYHDQEVKAKDRCRCTVNLTPTNEQQIPDGAEMDEATEAALLLESRRCPKCGSRMEAYLIDKNNKIYICSNAPVCDGFLREQGDFSGEAAAGPVVECEKCGHDMVLKEGRFGKYMLCTNEECKNTRKILKNGEVAPPREDAVDLPELICNQNPESHYVLRDGASGIFLAAHDFPKVRETRPVTVGELRRFRERISPKFYYLADGPEFDSEGNPAQVRFSRKFKVQYLSSVDANGKQTSWAAYYKPESNTWEETVMRRSKTAAAAGSAEGEGEAEAPKKRATRKSTATKSRSTTKTTRKKAE